MATKNTRLGGLGKGLDALFDSYDVSVPETVKEKVVAIDINSIKPMHGQPRQNFNKDELQDLAESIKEHGVLQPIIVNQNNDRKTYTLIAGERRWRASRLAGKNEIPAIIRSLEEIVALQHSIVENIQRVNLNAIEEAEAFNRLICEYNITQEKLSKILGRSRSAVANTLRLNNLSDATKKEVLAGNLSEGHARSLLALESSELESKACAHIKQKHLNVRETEKLVKRLIDQANNKSRVRKLTKAQELQKLSCERVSEGLTKMFGTKVQLVDNRGKGKITFDYADNNELNRILDLLGYKE